MHSASVVLTSVEPLFASERRIVSCHHQLCCYCLHAWHSICRFLQPFQCACRKFAKAWCMRHARRHSVLHKTLDNQYSDGICMRTPHCQKRLGLCVCVCVHDAASLGCRAYTHIHHRQTATPPGTARGHHCCLRFPPGSPEYVSQGAHNLILLT